jgi:hypothetical protein
MLLTRVRSTRTSLLFVIFVAALVFSTPAVRHNLESVFADGLSGFSFTGSGVDWHSRDKGHQKSHHHDDDHHSIPAIEGEHPDVIAATTAATTDATTATTTAATTPIPATATATATQFQQGSALIAWLQLQGITPDRTPIVTIADSKYLRPLHSLKQHLEQWGRAQDLVTLCLDWECAKDPTFHGYPGFLKDGEQSVALLKV